jgi:hypothetical protein
MGGDGHLAPDAVVQIVSGVLAVLIVVIIILRRKKKQRPDDET